MANTYTNRLNLAMPATADRYWDVALNGNTQAIEALFLGGLNVATAETPSATLNVKVAPGSFRSGSGAVLTYAGTAALALTAGATNYIYLSDSGTLTVNTTGFPTFGNIVPLAIATAGAATVTGLTDARSPWFALGGHVHWGIGAPTIAAGPGAGTSPTVAIVGSDQAGQIALTTGTAPSASSVLATISFGQAFSSTPRAVLLTPAGANASALSGASQVWADLGGLSTAHFTLNAGPSAPAASTSYKWYYAVIG